MLRLVKNSRITLLGFGNIGRSIGRLAKTFGARLYGVKRRPTPAPDFFTTGDLILPLDKLDSILPESDHLVLCLPNTPDTTNILNRERLRLLPPHASAIAPEFMDFFIEDFLARYAD